MLVIFHPRTIRHDGACPVGSSRESELVGGVCAETHGGGDPHQLTHDTSRAVPCRGADAALGCSGAEPMLLGTCHSRCTFITANHPPANRHLTLLLTGASPSCSQAPRQLTTMRFWVCRATRRRPRSSVRIAGRPSSCTQTRTRARTQTSSSSNWARLSRRSRTRTRAHSMTCLAPAAAAAPAPLWVASAGRLLRCWPRPGLVACAPRASTVGAAGRRAAGGAVQHGGRAAH